MSTAPAALPTCTAVPPQADRHPSVRTSLVGYAVTLLPLLVGLAAVELGWELTAGSTWAAAAAAVTGWTPAVAGWLRLRGCRRSTVLLVSWAPAAVLVAPLAAGWLSPAGLVLWGPVTTVLTVALTMAERPPGSAILPPADLAARA